MTWTIDVSDIDTTFVRVGALYNSAHVALDAINNLVLLSDGSRAFASQGGLIYEYLLAPSWNIASLPDANTSLSIVTYITSLPVIALSTDDTRIYAVGDRAGMANAEVHMFTMSTPGDLSTATYTGTVELLELPGTYIRSIAVNPTEDTILVCSVGTNNILQYRLITPADITTAVHVKTHTGYGAPPYSMQYSGDGLSLIALYSGETIRQFDMSVAFDPTDLSTNSNSVTLTAFSHTSLYIGANGTKVYSTTTSTTPDYIREYKALGPFLAEGLSVTDTDATILSTNGTSSETTNLSDQLINNFPVPTEGILLSDNTSIKISIDHIVTETFSITDTITSEVLLGFLEALVMSDIVDSTVFSVSSIEEAVTITDSLLMTLVLALYEGIDITDTLSVNVTVLAAIAEALALTDPVTNELIVSMGLTEYLGLVDALARSFERSATEALDISDIIASSLIASYLNTEVVDLTDATIGTALLTIALVEDVSIIDTLTTIAQLQNVVDEGIIFATSFIHDGTMYTGWVMNSENFAVSQYDNYDFTSFGRLNGKYYGVKPDGLYLLEGGMDDTAYITATIKTAAMDMGTSNLKAVPQAYFGFTGDGSMVMKIIVDDKTETWYNMISTSEGLHSQRLKLSKGLQGRYFQFELVSQNNTTLELDTIELYPIVLKRKL